MKFVVWTFALTALTLAGLFGYVAIARPVEQGLRNFCFDGYVGPQIGEREVAFCDCWSGELYGTVGAVSSVYLLPYLPNSSAFRYPAEGEMKRFIDLYRGAIVRSDQICEAKAGF